MNFDVLVWLVFGSFANSGEFSITFSSGCGSSDAFACIFVMATSRAVSVAAQKKGGDSLHPICKASGITNLVGSLLFNLGRT